MGAGASVSCSSENGCDLVKDKCPVPSASFHLQLTCHESLGSGKLTDITMDSTSKLGVLTAQFLTSFSGRKSFSAKRTSCPVVSMGDKGREKGGGAAEAPSQETG